MQSSSIFGRRALIGKRWAFEIATGKCALTRYLLECAERAIDIESPAQVKRTALGISVYSWLPGVIQQNLYPTRQAAVSKKALGIEVLRFVSLADWNLTSSPLFGPA